MLLIGRDGQVRFCPLNVPIVTFAKGACIYCECSGGLATYLLILPF